MSDSPSRPCRIVAGYDGSAAAADALHLATRLVPGAEAEIVHLWRPELPEGGLRSAGRSGTLDEAMRAVEAEAEARALRRASDGVAIASAQGWAAEPRAQRGLGDHGMTLARAAERRGADLLVVGSSGLSGTRALLGSVSDSTVHYSPVPVLVVATPLTGQSLDAAAAGPVLVAFDGSAGAEQALGAAATLFAGREIVAVHAARADEPAPDAPNGVTALTVPVGRRLGAGRAVADALAAAAQERGAAVVVIGSRGRPARREIALGSVAMATLHHGGHPTIIVPGPAGADEERITG